MNLAPVSVHLNVRFTHQVQGVVLLSHIDCLFQPVSQSVVLERGIGRPVAYSGVHPGHLHVFCAVGVVLPVISAIADIISLFIIPVQLR